MIQYKVKIKTLDNRLVNFGYLADNITSARIIAKELFGDRVVSIPKELENING